MLRGAGEEYRVNPVLSRALDRIFILHADHEQNASTSTVRLAGSSGANPSPASRLASPACGAGARRRQRGGAQDAGGDRHAGSHPEYIAKAKDKNDPSA